MNISLKLVFNEEFLYSAQSKRSHNVLHRFKTMHYDEISTLRKNVTLYELMYAL